MLQKLRFPNVFIYSKQEENEDIFGAINLVASSANVANSYLTNLLKDSKVSA